MTPLVPQLPVISRAEGEEREQFTADAVLSERQKREAFRRAIRKHDWGHMNQSLDAAGLGWHGWLTTNFTRFAERYLAPERSPRMEDHLHCGRGESCQSGGQLDPFPETPVKRLREAMPAVAIEHRFLVAEEYMARLARSGLPPTADLDAVRQWFKGLPPGACENPS